MSRIDLSTSPPTEKVLITDYCQQYPTHSVDAVMIGPRDGKLYVTGGEGADFFTMQDMRARGETSPNVCGDPVDEGGALRSQDWRTTGDPLGLDGTVIRVDPDTGEGLPGNPGYSAATKTHNVSRIIAYGLRNPFRATFEPTRGDLWLGDVGWGTWERIYRMADPSAGVTTPPNFGWPCFEGNQALTFGAFPLCESLYEEQPAGASVTRPYFAFEHGQPVVPGDPCPTGSSSVSGVAFARADGPYPDAYDGALFFADYSRGCIYVMRSGADGLPNAAAPELFGLGDPVDLQIGPGGDLFYVDLFTGTVRRISYYSGNQPPIAAAAVSNADPPLNTPVQFSSEGSSDPDPAAGDVLAYAWDLDGDEEFDDSTDRSPAFTYTAPTNVSVRLKVTDGFNVSTVSEPIALRPGNTPPTARIVSPTTGSRWAPNQELSFMGEAFDGGVALPPAAMSWGLVLQHCPGGSCHAHPITSFPGVRDGSFDTPEHDYPSYLELTLTVTDSRGATDVETMRLDPATAVVRAQSDAPGVPLTLGDTTSSSPVERTYIAGSRVAVAAPATAGGLIFDRWSDGGAASHLLNPAGPTTLVASYRSPAVTGSPEPTPAPSPAPADRSPPRLVVSIKKRQPALRTRAIRLTARCADEPCVVRATGTMAFGARSAGYSTRGPRLKLGGGRRATLLLRLSRKALQKARRASRRRQRVTIVVSVVAKDAAGNPAKVKRTVELVP